MSARILLTIAVSLFAAAAAHSAGTATGSGLYGKVVIEPATPVCRVGTSCSRPAKSFRLAFLQNGRIVKTTITARVAVAGSPSMRDAMPFGHGLGRGRGRAWSLLQ